MISRGWVDPVPDPLLLRKSGSAGNRTRDLCIYSQKLWPLDHRGGQITTTMINFLGIWGHVLELVETKIALVSITSICSTDLLLDERCRFLRNYRKELQTYTSSHLTGCISYYAPPCKTVISHNSYTFWHIFSSEMNWASKNYASGSHRCCRLSFSFKHPVELAVSCVEAVVGKSRMSHWLVWILM